MPYGIYEHKKGYKRDTWWLRGKPRSEETKRKLRIAHLGKKISEEQKQKISIALTGKKMLPQTRAALLLANTGRKCSEETRRKISISNTGKKHNNIPWLKGKKMPEELRKKLSAAHTGKHGGEKNISWRGGIQRDSAGYILIYSPAHPFRNSRNCVFEHRLVMEKHLGRYLTPEEVVHHENEIKDDNRIENLRLFSGVGKHNKYHRNKLKNSEVLQDGK